MPPENERRKYGSIDEDISSKVDEPHMAASQRMIPPRRTMRLARSVTNPVRPFPGDTLCAPGSKLRVELPQLYAHLHHEQGTFNNPFKQRKQIDKAETSQEKRDDF